MKVITGTLCLWIYVKSFWRLKKKNSGRETKTKQKESFWLTLWMFGILGGGIGPWYSVRFTRARTSSADSVRNYSANTTTGISHLVIYPDDLDLDLTQPKRHGREAGEEPGKPTDEAKCRNQREADQLKCCSSTSLCVVQGSRAGWITAWTRRSPIAARRTIARGWRGATAPGQPGRLHLKLNSHCKYNLAGVLFPTVLKRIVLDIHPVE